MSERTRPGVLTLGDFTYITQLQIPEWKDLKIQLPGDFPGGPELKILYAANERDSGSIPGLGTKSHVSYSLTKRLNETTKPYMQAHHNKIAENPRQGEKS